MYFFYNIVFIVLMVIYATKKVEDSNGGQANSRPNNVSISYEDQRESSERVYY